MRGRVDDGRDWWRDKRSRRTEGNIRESQTQGRVNLRKGVKVVVTWPSHYLASSHTSMGVRGLATFIQDRMKKLKGQKFVSLTKTATTAHVLLIDLPSLVGTIQEKLVADTVKQMNYTESKTRERDKVEAALDPHYQKLHSALALALRLLAKGKDDQAIHLRLYDDGVPESQHEDAVKQATRTLRKQRTLRVQAHAARVLAGCDGTDQPKKNDWRALRAAPLRRMAVRRAIQELRADGVHVQLVRSPGEADFALAQEGKRKDVIGVISTDSDFFLVAGITFFYLPALQIQHRKLPFIDFVVNMVRQVDADVKCIAEQAKCVRGIPFTTDLVAKVLDMPSPYLPHLAYLCGNDYSPCQLLRVFSDVVCDVRRSVRLGRIGSRVKHEMKGHSVHGRRPCRCGGKSNATIGWQATLRLYSGRGKVQTLAVTDTVAWGQIASLVRNAELPTCVVQLVLFQRFEANLIFFDYTLDKTLLDCLSDRVYGIACVQGLCALLEWPRGKSIEIWARKGGTWTSDEFEYRRVAPSTREQHGWDVQVLERIANMRALLMEDKLQLLRGAVGLCEGANVKWPCAMRMRVLTMALVDVRSRLCEQPPDIILRAEKVIVAVLLWSHIGSRASCSGADRRAIYETSMDRRDRCILVAVQLAIRNIVIFVRLLGLDVPLFPFDPVAIHRLLVQLGDDDTVRRDASWFRQRTAFLDMVDAEQKAIWDAFCLSLTVIMSPWRRASVHLVAVTRAGGSVTPLDPKEVKGPLAEEPFLWTSEELPCMDETRGGRLPIDAYHTQIVKTVNTNDICMVEGATGSGKSTRVPVFLYRDVRSREENVKIVVTQPRRLAAKSVAEHVAESGFGENIGETVGVRISGEAIGHHASVLYVTAGWLVTKFIHNPEFFTDCTHIIMDEVHERDMACDLLCMIVREYWQSAKMRSVRVPSIVIMSATLCRSTFIKYFEHMGTIGVITVRQKRFPVKCYHLDELHEWEVSVGDRVARSPLSVRDARAIENELCDTHVDRVPQVLQARTKHVLLWLLRELAQRHAHEDDATCVLVFVDGLMTMEHIVEALAKSKEDATLMQVCVAHALVDSPVGDLMAPLKSGVMRVILSTIMCESSVTVPYVKYVIDTGLRKVSRFNVHRQRNELTLSVISRASATQRAGRCGRERAGTLFRLYSASFMRERMIEHNEAEMSQGSLMYTFLSLMTALEGRNDNSGLVTHPLGSIRYCLSRCLDPPQPSVLDHAHDQLIDFGAIVCTDHDSCDGKERESVACGDDWRSDDELDPDDERNVALTSVGSFCSALSMLPMSSTLLLWCASRMGSTLLFRHAVFLAVALSETFDKKLNPRLMEPGKYVSDLHFVTLRKVQRDQGLFSDPLRRAQIMVRFLCSTNSLGSFCFQEAVHYVRFTATLLTFRRVVKQMSLNSSRVRGAFAEAHQDMIQLDRYLSRRLSPAMVGKGAPCARMRKSLSAMMAPCSSMVLLLKLLLLKVLPESHRMEVSFHTNAKFIEALQATEKDMADADSMIQCRASPLLARQSAAQWKRYSLVQPLMQAVASFEAFVDPACETVDECASIDLLVAFDKRRRERQMAPSSNVVTGGVRFPHMSVATWLEVFGSGRPLLWKAKDEHGRVVPGDDESSDIEDTNFGFDRLRVWSKAKFKFRAVGSVTSSSILRWIQLFPSMSNVRVVGNLAAATEKMEQMVEVVRNFRCFGVATSLFHTRNFNASCTIAQDLTLLAYGDDRVVWAILAIAACVEEADKTNSSVQNVDQRRIVGLTDRMESVMGADEVQGSLAEDIIRAVNNIALVGGQFCPLDSPCQCSVSGDAMSGHMHAVEGNDSYEFRGVSLFGVIRDHVRKCGGSARINDVRNRTKVVLLNEGGWAFVTKSGAEQRSFSRLFNKAYRTLVQRGEFDLLRRPLRLRFAKHEAEQKHVAVPQECENSVAALEQKHDAVPQERANSHAALGVSAAAAHPRQPTVVGSNDVIVYGVSLVTLIRNSVRAAGGCAKVSDLRLLAKRDLLERGWDFHVRTKVEKKAFRCDFDSAYRTLIDAKECVLKKKPLRLMLAAHVVIPK